MMTGLPSIADWKRDQHRHCRYSTSVLPMLFEEVIVDDLRRTVERLIMAELRHRPPTAVETGMAMASQTAIRPTSVIRPRFWSDVRASSALPLTGHPVLHEP